MIAFKRNILSNNALQGIFCIDEFDASLHPVAQVRLFDFIYNWAKRNNIQVIATTHSLFLVKHFIDKQKNESNKSF